MTEGGTPRHLCRWGPFVAFSWDVITPILVGRFSPDGPLAASNPKNRTALFFNQDDLTLWSHPNVRPPLSRRFRGSVRSFTLR
jgi:hypothetical protein